jgi:hypothetical protein
MLVIQIGTARIWSDNVPRVARRRLPRNALTTTGLSFDLVALNIAQCALLGKRWNLSLKFDSMSTPSRRQRGKFLNKHPEARKQGIGDLRAISLNVTRSSY